MDSPQKIIAIMPPGYRFPSSFQVISMSQSHHNQQQDQAPAQTQEADGYADAFAAIAVIAIVVSTVVFWLKSM